MNCIVIDDDVMSVKSCEALINTNQQLKLIKSFSSPVDAANEIDLLKIDLIFLDVEMPEMSGIEFLERFKEIPQVILMSSKKNYALDAFEYNVTDYLVKPLNQDRFDKAIDKAVQINESVTTKNQVPDSIFIKEGTRLYQISLSDISHIEALSDYVKIHTDEKRYTVLSTMKSIETKLDDDQFIRVHRSYIIRKDRIDEIDENIIMIGDHSIPISRGYKSHFMSKINTF